MKERSRTYIARRRPVELVAEPVQEEQVIDTWEGPRTAQPGDYVMTGVRGERWPVAGGEFERLYDVLGPTEGGSALRVRKKPLEVPFFQTYRPLDFKVRGENFHAGTGYFILSYGEGAVYPCEPGVFFETFEILRPAGEDEEFDVR